METSFSYTTQDNSNPLSNSSQRTLQIITSYTRNVGQRFDLTLSVPFSYRRTELSVPLGEISESNDEYGLNRISVGGRHVLRLERGSMPEFTLISDLSFPINIGNLPKDDIRGSLGLSAVKTVYPVFLFASLSISSSLENIDPSINYVAGIAFALNEKINLGLSINGATLTDTVDGLLNETATLRLRTTYAVSHNWFAEGSVGLGLTEQSSNRLYTFSLGRRF